jgi:polar amino acid transport system substrate-binding protein
VAVKGGSGASATSLSALKQLKLGVQASTTSLTWINEVVNPTQTPQIYDNTNDPIKALENKQIDALVVDLPTAYYVATKQMKSGVVVAQAKTGGDTGEQYGLVLEKNSTLTSCVDKALTALKSNGELQAIQDKWLSSVIGAPYLTP